MDITRIYLVTNCYGDSNKVYIGKTKGTRYINHKQKYGNNIIYDYIDEVKSLNKNDWEPLETFWINYFKFLGFDVQNKRMKGGSGPEFQTSNTKNKISQSLLGHKHTLEQRNKRKEIRRGINLSQQTKDRIGQSNLGKGNKPILQYDLEGNFIKEWDSTIEVSIYFTNKNKCGLFNALKNNKRRFGYLWKYKTNNYPLKIDSYKRAKHNRISKHIIQYDLEGNFIKEWSSTKLAGQELLINIKDINSCCLGKLKTAGKYRWSYKLN